ncbi:hypothetical protein BKA24_001726 [Microbacterium marinum]|uniref:Uncharacterized protein n=1 Tax=Microbacterium marinum TaxID=421115 RepID=A0A7W7BQK9_9MICO|nr:hypothetical protein [Microbacterium marinum]MBB4667017.1 hypothetical protein [Microbacterium marinum]
MSNPPGTLRYGRVYGRFVSFIADGPDEGDEPDEVPLNGAVTLTPSITDLRWPSADPPRMAVIKQAICPIINGDIYPPGTTKEQAGTIPQGVWIVATDQPDGEPDKVQWTASFQLQDVAVQPATTLFDVPHLGAANLALLVPAQPHPGVIKVVSSEDRMAAEAAVVAAGELLDDMRETLTAAPATAKIVGDNLVLTTVGGVDAVAGNVRGQKGDKGDIGDLSPTAIGAQSGSVGISSLPLTRTWPLNGNITLQTMPSFSSSIAGTVTLIIRQAATGGPYTVTFPSNIVWSGPQGAPAPVMPTQPNAEMTIHLFWTGQRWQGVLGGVFVP